MLIVKDALNPTLFQIDQRFMLDNDGFQGDRAKDRTTRFGKTAVGPNKNDIIFAPDDKYCDDSQCVINHKNCGYEIKELTDK